MLYLCIHFAFAFLNFSIFQLRLPFSIILVLGGPPSDWTLCTTRSDHPDKPQARPPPHAAPPSARSQTNVVSLRAVACDGAEVADTALLNINWFINGGSTCEGLGNTFSNPLCSTLHAPEMAVTQVPLPPKYSPFSSSATSNTILLSLRPSSCNSRYFIAHTPGCFPFFARVLDSSPSSVPRFYVIKLQRAGPRQ